MAINYKIKIVNIISSYILFTSMSILFKKLERNSNISMVNKYWYGNNFNNSFKVYIDNTYNRLLTPKSIMLKG